jgi:serine/arginine repetitive matrix protein 1
MKKVNLEVLKPWISQKVVEMLEIEDDVVISYIFGLLEEKVCCREVRCFHSY